MCVGSVGVVDAPARAHVLLVGGADHCHQPGCRSHPWLPRLELIHRTSVEETLSWRGRRRSHAERG